MQAVTLTLRPGREEEQGELLEGLALLAAPRRAVPYRAVPYRPGRAGPSRAGAGRGETDLRTTDNALAVGNRHRTKHVHGNVIV